MCPLGCVGQGGWNSVWAHSLVTCPSHSTGHLLLPIPSLPPKQPTPPSAPPSRHLRLLLTTACAATAPITGAVNPMTCASFTSPASIQVPARFLQSDLPSMRINCHVSSQDKPSSMRLNCWVASQAKVLPSRRLNCSSAASATNPCIAQCVRCHISRLASPLQHLAAALRIRARYGLGPHSSKE